MVFQSLPNRKRDFQMSADQNGENQKEEGARNNGILMMMDSFELLLMLFLDRVELQCQYKHLVEF